MLPNDQRYFVMNQYKIEFYKYFLSKKVNMLRSLINSLHLCLIEEMQFKCCKYDFMIYIYIFLYLDQRTWIQVLWGDLKAAWVYYWCSRFPRFSHCILELFKWCGIRIIYFLTKAHVITRDRDNFYGTNNIRLWLSFCPFSFGHCVVCSDSDYPFGIFKLSLPHSLC